MSCYFMDYTNSPLSSSLYRSRGRKGRRLIRNLPLSAPLPIFLARQGWSVSTVRRDCWTSSWLPTPYSDPVLPNSQRQNERHSNFEESAALYKRKRTEDDSRAIVLIRTIHTNTPTLRMLNELASRTTKLGIRKERPLFPRYPARMDTLDPQGLTCFAQDCNVPCDSRDWEAVCLRETSNTWRAVERSHVTRTQ